jgi:hypothetical protein
MGVIAAVAYFSIAGWLAAMMLGLCLLLAVVGWGLNALSQMRNGGMILFIILAVLAVELAAELVMAAWAATPIHGILHLLGLPLRLLRLRRGGQSKSLQQKNITRAAGGAFVLVVCAVLAVYGFPVIGWQITAGIAALALLYLVVGVCGSQGARFDFMRVFWPAALALGCVALLIFIGGFRL